MILNSRQLHEVSTGTKRRGSLAMVDLKQKNNAWDKEPGQQEEITNRVTPEPGVVLTGDTGMKWGGSGVHIGGRNLVAMPQWKDTISHMHFHVHRDESGPFICGELKHDIHLEFIPKISLLQWISRRSNDHTGLWFYIMYSQTVFISLMWNTIIINTVCSFMLQPHIPNGWMGKNRQN